jgi:hypothetical protein
MRAPHELADDLLEQLKATMPDAAPMMGDRVRAVLLQRVRDIQASALAWAAEQVVPTGPGARGVLGAGAVRELDGVALTLRLAAGRLSRGLPALPPAATREAR